MTEREKGILKQGVVWFLLALWISVVLNRKLSIRRKVFEAVNESVVAARTAQKRGTKHLAKRTAEGARLAGAASDATVYQFMGQPDTVGIFVIQALTFVCRQPACDLELPQTAKALQQAFGLPGCVLP